jgi:hypothetical protein
MRRGSVAPAPKDPALWRPLHLVMSLRPFPPYAASADGLDNGGASRLCAQLSERKETRRSYLTSLDLHSFLSSRHLSALIQKQPPLMRLALCDPQCSMRIFHNFAICVVKKGTRVSDEYGDWWMRSRGPPVPPHTAKYYITSAKREEKAFRNLVVMLSSTLGPSFAQRRGPASRCHYTKLIYSTDPSLT